MPYGYGSSNRGPGPGGQGARGQATQNPGRAPAPTYQNVHQTGAITQTPGRPPSTVTTGGGPPVTRGGPPSILNRPRTIPKGITTTGGITNTNRFKKWLASKNPFKKPMIEYFYPEEHGDMYVGLQTGKIPTSNYHKDVTADYWKNVSKNWGEVHPALGAMVNVGAPAGTMIGGLMYDLGQAYTRMEPDSGLSGYAKAVAAEQPIKSNLQRMAGSVEPLLNAWGIGNNLNYARGGIVDLYRYGGF